METCWLRNSCIVYERKTKDCAGSWTPSNINFGVFVCSFDQFPVLTMIRFSQKQIIVLSFKIFIFSVSVPVL